VRNSRSKTWNSDMKNGRRTCTDPVQWPDSGRLSYEISVCPSSLYKHTREKAHSSLPSPPSCAWKLPETNGPYRDRMRPLACVCIPCEFIPKLRQANAQDELRGLPASSGELRLMWHEKLSRTDHDRRRDTDHNMSILRGPGGTGNNNACRVRMIGYSILETT
jgi:hypothetical protein